MAWKRKKVRDTGEHKDISEYYRLHRKAVDDLVTADVTNSPKVSEEELRKYRSGPNLHFPEWAGVVFLKIWFAGAVCFFFFWGLGLYLPDQLDQLAVLGAALGIVTDVLTNSILRYYAKTPGDNDRWMMFPKWNYAGFLLNIVYAYVLLLFVFLTYNLINIGIIQMTGIRDRVPLGVGPILFGVFVTVYDLIFVGCRNILSGIIKDARRKVEEEQRGRNDV